MDEKEYISREAAIEIIEEKQRELCPLGMFSRHAVYGSDREKFDAWEEIIEQMNRVPAADVRPVVTCSDCKWWTKQESSLQGRCELLQMYPTGAWFCADGKREES